MNTFSTSQALTFGWKTTKEHFGYLVSLFVIVMIANIIFGMLNSIPVVGFLASVAGQMILGMGVTRSILSLKRGQKLSYEALYKTTKPFWRFLGASLLSGLIVMAGFILFIIPGFIFALALMFVKYIVVDTEKPVVESLQESARITKGYRWQLFGFAITAAVINIAGALLFGVGLLITIPVTLLATAYVYDELMKRPGDSTPAPAKAHDHTEQKPVGENNA